MLSLRCRIELNKKKMYKLLSHESEYKVLNHLVGMHRLGIYTEEYFNFVIESQTFYTKRKMWFC